MRHALFLAPICLLALVAVPGASAQSPDRDSPAGQEYRIPIDYTRCEYSPGGCDKAKNARNDGPAGRGGGGEGTGGSGSGGDAQEGSPLFGAGIKPLSDGGSGTDGRAGRGGDAADAVGRDGSRQRSDVGGRLGDDASAAGDPVRAGLGTIDDLEADKAGFSVPTGGLALGVLAAGGLLGLGFRRLSRNRTA